MLRRLLVAGVLAFTAQRTAAPAPPAGVIARYPLVADLNDATARHGPATAVNAPILPGKGLFCNGRRVTPDACDVRTPELNELDLSSFTIAARFLVPPGVPFLGPVFVGGGSYRWIAYNLLPGGRIELSVNGRPGTECSVRYAPGVWHDAAVTYDGTTVTLFLDGVAGCTISGPLVTNNEKHLSLTNNGNGTTFHGAIRDLTVWNGVRPPAKHTPEPDDLVLPGTAPDTPIDMRLARCPTREEIASVDADLRLTFETDPTSHEPLACRATTGSGDLSPMKKRVYNALLAMRQIEFDRPLPWTHEPLYRWLTHAITGVRFRGDIQYSSCCVPDRVINVAASDQIINYTDRWIDPIARGGVVSFVLLLAHESRHAEGHPHTCGTKDRTPDELGAWGVQYYLTRWLAEHADQSLFSGPSVKPSEILLKQAEMLRAASFCSPERRAVQSIRAICRSRRH